MKRSLDSLIVPFAGMLAGLLIVYFAKTSGTLTERSLGARLAPSLPLIGAILGAIVETIHRRRA